MANEQQAPQIREPVSLLGSGFATVAMGIPDWEPYALMRRDRVPNWTSSDVVFLLRIDLRIVPCVVPDMDFERQNEAIRGFMDSTTVRKRLRP